MLNIVNVINLKEDDLIIVKTEQHLDEDIILELRKGVVEFFGGPLERVLVLHSGISIDFVRKENA